MYLISFLHATSNQIHIDHEIKDAQWMHPNILKHECSFPTVLSSIKLLESGNIMNLSMTGKHHQLNNRQYMLYVNSNINQ